MTPGKLGFAGRVAHYFINSKLTPLVMVFSVLLAGMVFLAPIVIDPLFFKFKDPQFLKDIGGVVDGAVSRDDYFRAHIFQAPRQKPDHANVRGDPGLRWRGVYPVRLQENSFSLK